MPPEDLHLFARAIAPIIDRLVIAVHRHGRPEGLEVLRAFGLSTAGVLIDARPLLLSGPITVSELATIERYAPEAALADALERHTHDGILMSTNLDGITRYAPTNRGHDLLTELTAAQGRVITRLWPGEEHDLPVLMSTMARVIELASTLARDGRYPAFLLQVAAPDPAQASPAQLLLARLTALRYFRADAHARSWAVHELDAVQAAAMTALWRGGHIDIDACIMAAGTDGLERRGLIERDGARWRLTIAGQSMRDAIEAETDSGASAPWPALTERERDFAFRCLARLPY